ncbi:MAG: FAD-dependent oxidoreductase [Eubacteriales bacterium]|nr:FAD-dependent oxidoreductase [Eubacteriales bacterium]
MTKTYDVLIIGAGPSGIFAGFELARLRPDLKLAILEEGEAISRRTCPIVAGKVDHCVHCPICHIMHGFGGAGAFSDGKFNFTTEYGGWLNDYLSEQEVLDLIDEVDAINRAYGATDEIFSSKSEAAERIRLAALSHDIHLLDGRCKHLGTENNLEILGKQMAALEREVEIYTRCKVYSIQDCAGGYHLETQCGDFEAPYLIAAPGRAGAEWFAKECERLGLKLLNNQVDLGVRVELPALTFKHITDAMYEAKLKYRTKPYNDQVRTFCMNPYGHVVTENTDGVITVNGHSYSDPELQSENTNFALLVSNSFTQPFSEPYRYGKHIASLSNMLGGGIIVQRFGDLVAGRRTNEHRLKQSFTVPTLNATPGDLSLVLPKRHLDNIIDTINALDKLAPGTANYDTLLYGVEVKFYSSRLELSSELETGMRNFFAIGDGAGITRGLSQAGASGIHVARVIDSRMQKA